MSHLFVADESALQGLRRAGRGFSLRGLHVRRLQGQYPDEPFALFRSSDPGGKIQWPFIFSHLVSICLSLFFFFFPLFRYPSALSFISLFPPPSHLVRVHTRIQNANANKIVALSVQTRASSSRYNYRALYRPCWPTGLWFHVSCGKFKFVF